LRNRVGVKRIRVRLSFFTCQFSPNDTHAYLLGSPFPDETHALALGRRIVGNLHVASKGAPAAGPSSGAPPPLYNPEEIAGVVPADARQTYDVRDVIARVVDGSEFDEFKKLYGPVSRFLLR
jgi:hypothetical protein